MPQHSLQLHYHCKGKDINIKIVVLNKIGKCMTNNEMPKVHPR